ncbi:MAG: hypothetical protein HFH82_12975 [Lachnospiraceae bacterium]|nr:hypothetical protein [Lachnospiraceae bacterium]
MKLDKKWLYLGCLLLLCLLVPGRAARAEENETIKNGIYAEQIDLSGMTAAEAQEAVQAYVDALRDTEITLLAAADKPVIVTAGELGIAWGNSELVEEALSVGIRGNVIERYKKLKDLERENLVYPIELSFDLQAIGDVLLQKCTPYDIKSVPYGLVRENGKFRVLEGQTGYALDVETSIDEVSRYLAEEWDRSPCTISLNVMVDQPKGSVEELSQVKDVLGSFTTSYTTSNFNRCANIDNGCNLINGALVYPGEEFSMHALVTPFTAANGYYMAGSYMNGQVVDSLGGGICQVSTTLYNALLLAELDITERYNHSMIVTYVEPSADAAISESSGKDFKFINNLEYPVYIEGYTQNKHITFNIYGRETRSPNREVRYESKVLEVNHPTVKIYADASRPLGYVGESGSAHTGYKAQLWKVVLENGKEVSRTQVNSSSYKMVPKNATVGTATDDPTAYEEIMAAIGTGDIGHVKNVLAILLPAPEENEEDMVDDEE